MTEVKKGDFVRVTIRGEVSEVNNRDIVVGEFAGLGSTIIPREPSGHEVRVSVVEPPVEVFKAGDVVRDRDRPELLYLLTHNGYSELGTGAHYEDGPPTLLTSRHFERVNIE